jgi:hypothetical protein
MWFPFVLAGGAFVVFGPLALVLCSADGREHGQVASARFFAKAALWSGFGIYAGLAAAAVVGYLAAPAPGGPPRIVLWPGWTPLAFWAEVALGTNGLAVLWAWWILRDEERNPDRAMVDAAFAEEREQEDRRKKGRAAGMTPPHSGSG